jgi:hypothetical protein
MLGSPLRGLGARGRAQHHAIVAVLLNLALLLTARYG